VKTLKAKTEVDGQVIELDFSDVENRLETKMKKYMEELKEHVTQEKKEPRGKGVVESWRASNSAKLVEQLQNVEKGDITEQWSIVIPSLTAYEPAAHLRDYVFVTEAIKGKVGDIVEIPYVKDFDFSKVTVGSAFAGGLSLIATDTTVLHECGQYFDVPYEDIEKIDQNLLDELNRTFAHAAVRAEDYELLEQISSRAGSSFAGQAGLTDTLIIAGSTGPFKAQYIPEAIGLLIKAGKEVHPGDLVCVMGATAYADLLEELAGTSATAVAYARGDIITKGMVEDWLGVRILVAGSPGYNASPVYASGTSYEVAFLMRAKRCLALAPKRDILIETDRIIKTRKLTITGSHTFGTCCLDPTEAVRIRLGHAATHL